LFILSGMIPLTGNCHNDTGNLQASLYGGYNYLSIGGNRLLRLPIETDTLLTPSANNSFIGGIGAGYRISNHSNILPYIKAITIGPDLIFFNKSVHGNVLQLQDPQFPNYDYTLKLKTARLMLDGWLDGSPLCFDMVPFIGGGVGVANIKTSYYDVVSSAGFDAGISGGEISLGSKTTTNFAYSLGAGLKKQLSPRVQLSAAYIYTNYGQATTSINSSQVTLVTPVSFKVQSHSALLGLTYLFG